MKFWDTSAIIPLLVNEKYSDVVGPLFSNDPTMIVWWGTSIECISAISRLEREGKLSPKEANILILRLDELRATWREIQAVSIVKQHAERILKVHPLRAQDAQQLAACVVANSENTIDFVTLDERLSLCARKEGLRVLGEI